MRHIADFSIFEMSFFLLSFHRQGKQQMQNHSTVQQSSLMLASFLRASLTGSSMERPSATQIKVSSMESRGRKEKASPSLCSTPRITRKRGEPQFHELWGEDGVRKAVKQAASSVFMC